MKILVIANETAESPALQQFVSTLRADQALVVAPALIGRLDFWANDDRRARSAAGRRLDACLAVLGDVGVDAGGYIGDSDPIQAIEDALSVFAADKIVISTHPEGASNWLARKVVARARIRFRQPIHHILTTRSQDRAAA